MLFYVSGDDTYSKNLFINNLITGKEVVEYDMLNCEYGQIVSEVLSIDLLVTNKIYVFYNFKPLVNSSEKLSKVNTALLNEVFTSENEMIIVNDKEINKKTSWYKKLSELIKINHFPLKKLDFDLEINTFLETNQIAITEDGLEAIKNNLPNNIHAATNDLRKLWSYTNMRQITYEDVVKCGNKITEHKIFELYNLIVSGKTKAAVSYLELLKNEGISESDILLVSFTQIKRMYETKLLINKGMNDFNIASTLGVNSFAIKHNRKILRQVSEKRLETLILEIANLDYLFKSGQNTPDKLVDMLVLF